MENKKGGKREGSGRKKGVKKNKLLFGYKYTEEEYNELKKTFEEYKKRNGLTSTEAIKKIILEKNIDFLEKM